MSYTPEDFKTDDSGSQFVWLNSRLSIHGFPLNKWSDTFQSRVQAFQLKLGYKGTQPGGGADGFIGPKTLAALYVTPNSPVGKLPAQILNLERFKLTLPTDINEDDKADEIKQPALATYQHPQWFHVNGVGDGVVFRAPCDGFHTENSFFPRSELREQTLSGAGAAWNSADGKTHTMQLLQAITEVPDKKPHVVAGQIHDANDDVCMIRLEDKHLFVESEHAEDQTLDDHYMVGAKFRIKIVATKTGIDIWYNGIKKAHINGTFSGCYFKAGCYTQATSKVASTHDKYGDGAGEVVIYELEVTHE